MLMKGISRIVNTNFWLDESVVNDFSPEDKYFMLYLLTNPHTTQLGIYKFVPKTAGFEMGYSQEAVSCLIDRFENKYGIVKYSRKTGEIAIKNYLKYSVVKGGKPVMDCLLKEEEVVEDKSLLRYIYENMKNIDKLNITVKDYINHIPSILNDNENDNDNERYVDESLHESLYDSFLLNEPNQEKKTVKRFVPPTVEEVTSYCIEKGYEYVNPEVFIGHYDSVNWMVGKNKMSKWRSAVSVWNQRAIERGDRKHVFKKPVQQEKTVYQNRPRGRFETCPESTWSKLKQYVDIDGNFDWSAYDPSIMNAEDKRWMASVGM